MPQLKQIGINLLVGLGGIIFALVIGEIGLRIVGISYPSFYQADANRGHALIPGISGWWTHEGKGWVSVNKQGLRDKDYTLEKPQNTFRIAVLGDSFAEAIQVNADKTFWSLIENKLPQCQAFKGQKIEVINFGVGDYGTAQELMTLKNNVVKYSPDLVILAVFTGNDIINNSKVLSPPDRFSPFLVKQDGKYVLDTSFKETETYQWRNSWPRRLIFSIVNHSRILQVINEARVAMKNQRSILGNEGKPENKDVVNYLDFTPELYGNSNKDWQDAWDITEKLITLIRDETKVLNSDFLVVTLSNPAQVYPDLSLRENYFNQEKITNEFYPDERIANLGKKEQFEVLTLAPLLQAYADQNKQFLHGFDNTVMGSGHWNELGHQLAGELIADKVCSQQ
ncbi:SGNH/GDSL hydrolase family protein [Crocosphaera sp. UHCC 0190]|uniref:SGNH/GDSL hydrolase family protein n=1 Tax=Crocosphaera sp. UHCC 0190 TaxID=3110246 RepID=UPI002B22022A|nr:SGNH/GDSL hydrolase family protein [Crocosphaera sp. UHCC 0190]MEA5511699.1 SGNH/GDSL hydrolase family protein [Crocosphaera sp. UHCC 0190]